MKRLSQMAGYLIFAATAAVLVLMGAVVLLRWSAYHGGAARRLVYAILDLFKGG